MTPRVSLSPRKICFICLAFVLLGARTQAEPDESPAQLKQNIEARHPADYYKLAAVLFQQSSTKQEAIFWFYVGQIRYRYYLAANPDLRPDGDPAVFASLNQVIGQPINEYAGSQPDVWISAMNHALEWDASHENRFTPKTKSPEKYREVRAGLVALRDHIVSIKEQIPEIRRRNGIK